MCRIVGQRGITFGFIISSSISSGWLLGFVSTLFFITLIIRLVTDKDLDYVKDSVVEISRAYRRLAESDALQKGK